MSLKQFANGNNDAYLNDTKEFFDSLVFTTWRFYPGGSGFCIDPRGFILTCGHVIPDIKETIYVAHAASECHIASVVRVCYSCDIALLHVRANEKLDFVQFADETEQVFCGQEVQCIGNPNNLASSFTNGRVAYPFEGYVHNGLVCDDGVEMSYEHNASLNDVILDHRTFRSVISSGCHPFHPKVPLIQISILICANGSSGSPVFNNKGHVIGMHSRRSYYQRLSIHFSVLQMFIQNINLDIAYGNLRPQQKEDSGPEEKPTKKREKDSLNKKEKDPLKKRKYGGSSKSRKFC